MEYRYLTTSLTGCVQQLACNILPHGYWFYCMGRVLEKKDPFAIDAKLLGKYGIEISSPQLELLRVINQERQAAGYEKVPPSVLRYKRRIASPYQPEPLEVKVERIAA